MIVHFWPPSPSFCHFFDLCGPLKPRNYLKSARFVLFLLPIHFFNILVKLEHVNGVICIIIDNCVFLYFAYFAYYLHILAVDSLYKYAHNFFFARIQKLHQTFFVSTDMLLMKTGEKMRGQEMDTEPPSDPGLIHICNCFQRRIVCYFVSAEDMTLLKTIANASMSGIICFIWFESGEY